MFTEALLFSQEIRSNSLWPHGLWHPRLLCPWDFPGKNTGVGSHSLLPDPGMKPRFPVAPALTGRFFITERPGKPYGGPTCRVNPVTVKARSHRIPYYTYPSGRSPINATPLQYSCLENAMDGGPWWAAVHGVAKSRTRLSDITFTFHFHALEKAMATHSSVLAWRVPGMGEPGGLPSMGSHRVGHDWSDLAEAAAPSLTRGTPKDQSPAFPSSLKGYQGKFSIPSFLSTPRTTVLNLSSC